MSAAGECNQAEAVEAIRYSSDGVAPTTSEIQIRLAEFKAVIKDAQLGALRGDGWVAVARYPELWELRWRWDSGDEVRGYFHEPDGRWGHCAVLARVHVKWISQSPDRATCERHTKRAQNSEIDQAGRRIRAETEADWGLPNSPRILST